MTRALRIWAWILSADLLVRGLDYASGGGPYQPDDNLTVPEIWGVAFLVTFVLSTVGLLLRHSPLIKFACTVAFAVYLMVSVQLFTVEMLPVPWPPHDPRLSSTPLVLSLLWLSVAVIIWWREFIVRECEKEARGG